MPSPHCRVLAAVVVTLYVAQGVRAADLPIYDEALQSGFSGAYSYGGGYDFASTAQAHGGTHSVAFSGVGYNAVSFTHPSQSFSTAAYPTLHFWIRGAAPGAQQLELFVYPDRDNSATDKHAPLDGYIAGGAISSTQWREVTVPLASGALAVAAVERIDLQSEANGASQPDVYIDDVSLLGAATGIDPIFADGFEGGGVDPAPNGIVYLHDQSVDSLVSDRFVWYDAGGKQREAVLAHNDGGAAGPGGTRGGELRELRYYVGAAQRVVRASSSAFAGFGYVVSHPNEETFCSPGHGDTSSLGHFRTGTWTRLFEGRHHAIFRFTTTYPRYCTTGAPGVEYDVPVTIDWVFATGRDHPLWAVTWQLSSTSDASTPGDVPVNRLQDDSRGPYGELLFDGSASAGAHSTIAGVAWGDRYKFVSTGSPVSYASSWTWNAANTIPYVKLWTTAISATMGSVLTQPITQQDAGGYFGTDRWNTTSAAGNACAAGQDGANAHLMPCSYNWPYQSINYSLDPSNASPTNNTRLAWGTNFGFLGQSAYHIAGSSYYGGPLPDATAPGWPKKSYSVFVVLGTHDASPALDPVDRTVTQMEVLQSLSLSASVGSVATTGPAGVNRSTAPLPSDTIAYSPAGYDPVYSALTFVAAGNALDANLGVGSGTLEHPLLILRGYSGSAYPGSVMLGGVPLQRDVDYFPSVRSAAGELWLTLNRNLSGNTNHLQVSP